MYLAVEETTVKKKLKKGRMKCKYQLRRKCNSASEEAQKFRRESSSDRNLRHLSGNVDQIQQCTVPCGPAVEYGKTTVIQKAWQLLVTIQILLRRHWIFL